LHLWFVGNGICTTLFVAHAITTLHATVETVGLSLATGGAAGFLGAHYSARLVTRLGVRQALALSWGTTAFGFAMLLPALHGSSAVAALFVCQAIFGLGIGAKLPIELTYRNHVTPRMMRGRMHSYIRTLNWGVFALGAAAAGTAAARCGDRACFAVGIVAMLAAAIALRRSSMGDTGLSVAPNG